MGDMRLVVHDRRFSPCNANVQLSSPTPSVAMFFCFSIDRAMQRAVIAYHVLPIGDPPADAIRSWMRGRASLRSFVEGVDEHIGGDPARFLAALLSPMTLRDPLIIAPTPSGTTKAHDTALVEPVVAGAADAAGGAASSSVAHVEVAPVEEAGSTCKPLVTMAQSTGTTDGIQMPQSKVPVETDTVEGMATD